MPGLNPREAAHRALQSVLRRRRPLDEVLAGMLGPGGMLAEAAARDRAFARLLVTTALRRHGQIEGALAMLLERPLPKDAAREHDLLRLGAAQILFLETPAHAAVAETMRLVRPASRYRGLVNAVLRRLAREGGSIVAGQDAARLNTLDWLWQRWCAAYGEDTARRIAEAHLREPPLDITAPDPTRWQHALSAELLPTGTLRRKSGGAVDALPGFDQGVWWIQDAAAALPARLLGDVAGKTVIDLCAAPGGKTAQLASAGADVIAVERSRERAKRLNENLRRLKLTAATIVADATAWRPQNPADAVLLDAPCTATGTLRRHPDAAWLKQPQDLASMSSAQDKLLDAAHGMVKRGGMLVYCVCSLEPEEGPQRVAAFLSRHGDMTRAPITAGDVAGLAELVSADGDLRTLPCHLAEQGGMDGFYAARLLRS
ncbi:MAG TPA: RsmB/NOP family class I SAM-dependent RNA methyltransferase [Candidatus Cybelea sp.]|nr:RsmB/NOP family class I SAM-dependent RNA methyltransferase [Candidatus Cybelea sp.]